MSSGANNELFVIQPLYAYDCNIPFAFNFGRTQVLFLIHYM
jgi:hypothetical protein